MKQQNYINHIALVLDASASMSPHARELVRVADAQIAYLARRSQELDQETRVSVYTFSSIVQCLVFDKDVLRLPSIASLYRTGGRTALIDAAIQSQVDLETTSQIYGDHSFLTFVLTDGQENESRRTAGALASRLRSLPENWTVAVLVPNMLGKHEAKQFGFPVDNIAVWDATTTRGVVEVGETIRSATDSFMTGRARGVRGTRSIFSTGVDAVNEQTVRSTLSYLGYDDFKLLSVDQAAPIREWVHSKGLDYIIGKAYYQLTKTESIQSQKAVAVLEKSTGRVYAGAAARDLIGLPQMEVRVKPQDNPKYDVFVQSTSVNRKLVPGTRLLILQ